MFDAKTGIFIALNPPDSCTFILLYFYFAILFTGKSGSIVVCISPLTSLMMDQQAKYSLRDLKVEFVGEAQTDPLRKKKVLNGEVQLVFITPENIIEHRVYWEMLLSSVYQNNLITLAVDEAHCVKSWGDQFRKSLARIGDLRSLLPENVNIFGINCFGL